MIILRFYLCESTKDVDFLDNLEQEVYQLQSRHEDRYTHLLLESRLFSIQNKRINDYAYNEFYVKTLYLNNSISCDWSIQL